VSKYSVGRGGEERKRENGNWCLVWANTFMPADHLDGKPCTLGPLRGPAALVSLSANPIGPDKAPINSPPLALRFNIVFRNRALSANKDSPQLIYFYLEDGGITYLINIRIIVQVHAAEQPKNGININV
jgi:hypothetical protein